MGQELIINIAEKIKKKNWEREIAPYFIPYVNLILSTQKKRTSKSPRNLIKTKTHDLNIVRIWPFS
jgi:hypothetical protein